MSHPRRKGAGLRAGKVQFLGNAEDGYTARRDALSCPWRTEAHLDQVGGQWVATWRHPDGGDRVVGPVPTRQAAARAALDALDLAETEAWRVRT